MSRKGQVLRDQLHSVAVPVSDEVNAVVGETATLIEVDPEDYPTFIYLKAVNGGFNLRIGDFESGGMPGSLHPGASVTDGTAGFTLLEGESIVLSATEVTVKGYAAGSVLVYYVW